MEIGTMVVVRGRGLGTVSAIRDGVIIIAEAELGPGEESQFEIPAEGAADAIRAVVDRAIAERILDSMRMARGEAAPCSLALADRRAELSAIEIPKLRGLEPIGAFALDNRIAIGEAKPDVVADAEPGVWFAYARKSGDDFSELQTSRR